jgi:hypothetical protein
VRELQEQLNAAHKRITQLTPEETEFIVRNHKGFEG